MDYKTFEILRSFCRTDLVAYLDTSSSHEMYALHERLHGPIGELLYERQTAMRIFQLIDLTPKEKLAANMLAVINNHRAIAWQREPKTPDGSPPAGHLEQWQADALWAKTRAAIVEYDIACSGEGKLPLLTLLDSLAPEQNSQKPAPVVAVPIVSGSLKPNNKTNKTQIFEAKVLELMGKFWDERATGTTPTKNLLCEQVFTEMLRGNIRGERRFTNGMVRDAAKPWKRPVVLPAFVAYSKFNDRRHPFKGEK